MASVIINVDGEERKLYVDRWINDKVVPKVQKALNKKDKDRVAIVDGAEGSGKSVFAMQYGKLVDPTLNIDRICMTADSFKKALTNATMGQCVIYDEAFTGLSSRASLSQVNRILVEYMMEMRQNNLFVIVCMPTLFLLDKYVALWRAKELFHIYTKDDRRGFWCYFNRKKKKILYLHGKKEYDYSWPKSKMKGRFFDTYVVNEQAYRAKKFEALKQKKDKDVDNILAKRYLRQRDIAIRTLYEKTKYTQENIVDLFKEQKYTIDRTSLSKIIGKKAKTQEISVT